MEQETRPDDKGGTTPSATTGSSIPKRRISDTLDEDDEPNIATKKSRVCAEEAPAQHEQPKDSERTDANDGEGEAAKVDESSPSNGSKRARHTDESDTDEEQDERRCKRKRLDATSIGDAVVQTSPGLLRLPLELLIEILLELKYPQELLAVTRTCKYLCTTMLSPGVDFVWKRIRNAIKLPDLEEFDDTIVSTVPHKKYAMPGKLGPKAGGVRSFVGKEAAYAAFVFDAGFCEACGEQTDRLYTSFALRLRLCSRPACIIQFREQTGVVAKPDVDSLVWATVPVAESESLLGYSDRLSTWPSSGTLICRHADLEAAFQKYKPTETQIDAQTSSSSDLSASEITADEKRAAGAISRNVIWMKFCTALHKWKFNWLVFLRRLKVENARRGKALASAESWAESDLQASTVWTTFLEEKLKRHEVISTKELSILQPMIAEQVYAMEQKRKRKELARLQQENHRDIWKLYHELLKRFPPFPAYSTFCNLPVIQFLHSPEFIASGTRVREIQNSFIGKLLDHQHQDWVRKAEIGLLESLGFDRTWNQRIAGAKTLHPVRRLNARWQCRLCGVPDNWDGSLSFEDVCGHECKEKDLKKHRKGTASVWDAANFVVDEKARALVENSLTLLGRGVETTRYSDLDNVMCFCDSCDPPILVHFHNLLGHSHRHGGSIKLRLFTSGPAQQVARLGLTQSLLKHDSKAQKNRSRVIFKCKHCFERSRGESESSADPSGSTSAEDRTTDTNKEDNNTQDAVAATSNIRKEKKNISSIFDFNGLRSHLKSKHGIGSVRDEDYCFLDNVEFQEVKFAST